MFQRFLDEINWLYVLLAINVVYFALLYFVAPNLKYNSDYVLIGALSTDSVFPAYPWLLITANFIHLNFFHFLFNVLSFYSLGRIVLNFYPKKSILIVYIFAGLFGSLLTVAAATIFDNPMVSIGASGSIFGLAGFLVGGTLKKQRYGFGLPLRIPDLIFPIAAIFLVGFLPGVGVNNWAHLGGFLGGIALGFILKNELGEIKTKNYLRFENIAYYISLLILILSFFLLLFNAVRVIFA